MNPLLRPERGFLDHALAGIGCAAAGLAIGFSLNNSSFALFVSGMTAVSTILGYLLAKAFRNKNVAGLGTGLWIVISIACFFLVRPLNDALPGTPFEFKTMIGATLSWMLILCPLVSWRDQALLFLTLPSLALFGLVGTFDYTPGTWLFFTFLLCAGILYSRVHQRSMLERAELMGEGKIELLRRGAWRWMAGPEWALASGCVIVVLSLLTAPLLQASVQGVAGQVTVTLPQTPTAPTGPTTTGVSASDTFVGRGPLSPTTDPVFRIRIQEPTLIRAESMNVYATTGWNRRPININSTSPLVQNFPLKLSEVKLPYFPWADNNPPGVPMTSFQPLEFEIVSLQRLSRIVYRPGPIIGVLQTPNDGYFTASGEFYLNEFYRRNQTFKGTAAYVWPEFYKNRKTAKAEIWPELTDNYTSTRDIHPQVRETAMKLVEGIDSDYDKAMAIKTYIEKTCRYNLNAEAIPPRLDAAQYFLFESKEGYCDLFATAMTTMARSAGLPARYTMGYLINDLHEDEDGFYTVREKDYHAWCEIYFKGYGWIPFDATEGAAEVPGSGVGDASEGHIPFFERPWVQDSLKVLLVVVLIVPTVFYMLRQIVQSRRFIKDNEIVHLHNKFNQAVEILARSPKRFSQTTAEYVAHFAPKLGPLHEQASQIADQFDSALYGPEEARVGQALALRPVVAAFRKLAKEERKRAA
jgi:hypothetical protein